jgi:hypothetical protein
MGTVEKAEIRIGKAAPGVNRDARPASRFVRRRDSAQTVGFPNRVDEEDRGEERNCPWVLCMPTCLYRRTAHSVRWET